MTEKEIKSKCKDIYIQLDKLKVEDAIMILKNCLQSINAFSKVDQSLLIKSE